MRAKTFFRAAFLTLFAASVFPLLLIAKMRTISVEVTVPNPLGRVSIQEVYVGREKIFVVARLSQKHGLAAQVISIAKDELKLDVPALPIEQIIIGHSIGRPRKGYHFVKNPKDLKKQLKGARRIYPRRSE